MNIIDIVKNTIISHDMIKKGDRVLVALSGGSDSAAMTDILVKLSDELEFTVCAAHINHNMRKEALHDENFVRAYCEKAGIECYVKSADVLGYAKAHGISSELAGRKIRYDFFDEVKGKYGIDKIATAHNKNDSAESVLLHLIRGCGVDGLCGIPYMRKDIIRPVLDLTKAQIEKYCRDNSVEFVQDKTNFETDYTRNKIRNIILPRITDINENFINTVTNNSSIFRETSEFMTEYARSVYDKINDKGKLDVKMLGREHTAPSRIIIQMLFEDYTKSAEKLPLNFIDRIITLIGKNVSSKAINLPNGISARTEYGKLYFTKTETENSNYEIKVKSGEKISVPGTGFEVLIKEETVKNKNRIDKIYFYKKKGTDLYIRNRKNGDCFYPVGMTGRKKLSDLFCDMKIPAGERNNVPLLTENDTIIWVMGIRCDRRFSEGEILMSAQITERRKD
ncbi:MAG: tRNA lysidine(34) synthetase TilS [Clostridia bacterium]|nr:tRNA lysidine(34) synthetase TilS [Clostridia bacterium]